MEWHGSSEQMGLLIPISYHGKSVSHSTGSKSKWRRRSGAIFTESYPNLVTGKAGRMWLWRLLWHISYCLHAWFQNALSVLLSVWFLPEGSSFFSSLCSKIYAHLSHLHLNLPNFSKMDWKSIASLARAGLCWPGQSSCKSIQIGLIICGSLEGLILEPNSSTTKHRIF